MTGEFERRFYNASIYQASKNILSELGNNEPTLCEIILLIKAEHRKARGLPKTVSSVDEQAAMLRALEVRRLLGKDQNYNLKDRDYQKGVNLLKREMKRKGLVFGKFFTNQSR